MHLGARTTVLILLITVFNSASADRSLNRTLSEQFGQRFFLNLEYTHFDDSLDLLNYSEKLGVGARPDQASIGSIEIMVPYRDQWQFNYAYQDLSGRAIRSSEPTSVTTDVKAHLFEITYRDWSLGSWAGAAFLGLELGRQAPLTIDCYARSGLVLGGACESATLRFFDPDIYRSTGETVYLPVLTSQAKQQGFALGLSLVQKGTAWQFVHQVQAKHSKLEVQFDSPLFKVTDPFILDARFQGETVQAIINNLRAELPQAQPWSENTMTYEFSALRSVSESIMGVAKFRALKIWRSDYESASSFKDTTHNLALDFSLWYSPAETLSAYVRAELFQNYVAGFQPLAYNRRTAKLFRHPYGQISFGVVWVTP